MFYAAFLDDLKYAFRGLRTKPGFAIAVVTTLGLGIGANAAMFGIVDRLLFRPPPLMKDPDTAHRTYLFSTFRGTERAANGGQFARYRDLAEFTKTFSAVAGYSDRPLAVGTGEDAREMPIGVVSANFFGFFDAPPALGRYFTEAEDRPPEGTAVAVLSHALWQTKYGGRTDVLGQAVQIGPVMYTIIGVAPSAFVGLWADKPPAAYLPLTAFAAATGFKPRTGNWWDTYSWGWMSTIVRRRPGVSIEGANADLSQAFRRSYEKMAIEQRRTDPIEVAKPRAEVGSILSDRGPNASSVAKVATWVGGVSVIVLLIAVANVANLMLARALRRRREIALRIALGVSRGRLVMQLVTESLLLAAIGGVIGLLLAHWGGAALRTFLLEKSEAAAGFRDSRTVLFAAGATIIVGLLTGLAPIFQARRADLTADLKSGSREGTYRASTARTSLLILQGALSVILLVGAGLFVRSLVNVSQLRLGYDVDPVLLVDLQMRGVKLDSAQTVALRERLLAAAQGMPEVQHASLQTGVPFWSTWQVGLFVEGIDTVSKLGSFSVNAVTSDYFATMGTRILRGRGINETDVGNSARVLVVSESMGRVLWPGRDAIGQCVRLNRDTMPCTEVVGIAEDIKSRSLVPDSAFYYYLPAMQFSPQNGGMFVRVKGSAKQRADAVRQRLQREMPGVSYVVPTPLVDIVGGQKRSWALGATMFAIFGGMALLLAAIGLYSVIAYNVAQRTHELGVRRALGAQASHAVRLVVVDGLRLAGIGVALGVAGAWWAGRFVKPLLFDVSPGDPGVFILVALTLVLVALAASWYPALRASRVDPSVALRSD
ncbi:MAG: ABC transporter permease [Cytophagaceae bacterium]|nr:ABC transporter permease [Gemmatimonadaceae bacterium]